MMVINSDILMSLSCHIIISLVEQDIAVGIRQDRT